MRLSIKEVANDLGIPQQGVRVGAQQGKFPFIAAVKMPGSTVFTYYIDEGRYKLWKKGELKT